MGNKSKTKKKLKHWETLWISESKDATWELINNGKNEIRLLFFNYDEQATSNEKLKERIVLDLTKDQLNSLLKFCEHLNK